ncbi:hypothetical protein BAOM_3935 [Peribacillus asahii]|uniref:Uncharacterized protein n=1 Tax=Peribacillus asahii TaxID=228899 RepID=A0A3T0KW41_9BACI|nr:hypothetical protein BAOM_3935 [Peribacillus asahii]
MDDSVNAVKRSNVEKIRLAIIAKTKMVLTPYRMAKLILFVSIVVPPFLVQAYSQKPLPRPND